MLGGALLPQELLLEEVDRRFTAVSGVERVVEGKLAELGDVDLLAG